MRNYYFFIILALMLSLVVPRAHADPEVWTDNLDYAPGEEVIITGIGFKPLTTLTINVGRPGDVLDTLYVESNEEGGFSCNYGPVLEKGEYIVMVSDGEMEAKTTFTDTLDFFAVPELPLGTISCLFSCFVALGLIYRLNMRARILSARAR